LETIIQDTLTTLITTTAWVVAQTTTIGITMDTADMEMATAETTITAITVMDTATIMEMDMETVLIMEITTENKQQVIHTPETMEEV
jgi:hypothetical protein